MVLSFDSLLFDGADQLALFLAVVIHESLDDRI